MCQVHLQYKRLCVLRTNGNGKGKTGKDTGEDRHKSVDKQSPVVEDSEWSSGVVEKRKCTERTCWRKTRKANELWRTLAQGYKRWNIGFGSFFSLGTEFSHLGRVGQQRADGQVSADVPVQTETRIRARNESECNKGLASLPAKREPGKRETPVKA